MQTNGSSQISSIAKLRVIDRPRQSLDQAQYCEVSVRTVKRHIYELEKQGFVKRIKRFDDSGRQRSNIYQLRLPSNDSHIQQADLDQAARGLDQEDRS